MFLHHNKSITIKSKRFNASPNIRKYINESIKFLNPRVYFKIVPIIPKITANTTILLITTLSIFIPAGTFLDKFSFR